MMTDMQWAALARGGGVVRAGWFKGNSPTQVERWLHDKRRDEARSIVRRWIRERLIPPMVEDRFVDDIADAYDATMRDRFK